MRRNCIFAKCKTNSATPHCRLTLSLFSTIKTIRSTCRLDKIHHAKTSASYEIDRWSMTWFLSHSLEAPLHSLCIVHSGATLRITYQSDLMVDFTHSNRSWFGARLRTNRSTPKPSHSRTARLYGVIWYLCCRLGPWSECASRRQEFKGGLVNSWDASTENRVACCGLSGLWWT